MEEVKVKINYSTFPLDGGVSKGVIAVLMYSGNGDPKIALDNAVRGITGDIGYLELIDAHLDNPWMRVLITNTNQLDQATLDLTKHKLKNLIQNGEQ